MQTQATQLVEYTVEVPAEQMLIEAHGSFETAAAVRITSAAASVGAQHLRSAIAYRIKELNEQRLEMTRPIDKSKARIMDFFNSPIERLEAAKAALDAQLVAWENSQEEARRLAQARIDQDAAAERRRLEQIALAEENEGRFSEADELRGRAAQIVTPIVAPDVVHVPGTSFREIMKFRVTNEAKIDRAYLLVDMPGIGKVVRAMGKRAETIVGGIEVYTEKSVASRRP